MDRSWTLMSSHGLVLFSIAAKPDITMRELSYDLDLTERRVAQIVRELRTAELIKVRRSGRRNFYSVRSDASFRHQTLSHIQIGNFERLFSDPEGKLPSSETAPALSS